MSGDFIDSNVFIYLFDETDAVRRSQAESLVREAIDNRSGVISYQVVQESLNVLTGKLKVPLPAEAAGRFLDHVLLPLLSVMPSAGLFHRALEIRSRYRFGFYDSLIVAGALAGGCDRLLTEDLQHGQAIDGLLIHNPFAGD